MNNTIIKTPTGFNVLPTVNTGKQNPIKPLPTYNPSASLKQDQKHPQTSQDATGQTKARDRTKATPREIKAEEPRENRDTKPKKFDVPPFFENEESVP